MKEFGEVIYFYTRARAISDGVIIDISELAKEAGFKVPVAVTEALYNGYLVPSESCEKFGQSISGRTWDLLILLHLACKSAKENTLLFSVRMLLETGSEVVEMKSVIGPGDKGEPVMTIMLPGED